MNRLEKTILAVGASAALVSLFDRIFFGDSLPIPDVMRHASLMGTATYSLMLMSYAKANSAMQRSMVVILATALPVLGGEVYEHIQALGYEPLIIQDAQPLSPMHSAYADGIDRTVAYGLEVSDSYVNLSASLGTIMFYFSSRFAALRESQ